MKRLPIGIQTFSKLREPESNFIYVDKTAVIHRLVEAGEYFFLSRPRRFGKSVMLSTLYELFRGNRELFKGLYIEGKWNWEKKHPVIRISFGSGDFSTEDKFNRAIYDDLKRSQRRLGITCEAPFNSPPSCFGDLITNAYEQNKQKVVILIDEYDKPILDHITDREIARKNRDKLKAFYSIIKDLDEYIRFVIITGVSKFSKMNLFFGLNNLRDITINSEFGTICGYTHDEVEEYFHEYLKDVDRNQLKAWYNGYNYFADPLYNPFDILLFFAEGKEYRPYWWSTGNPSFLIDLLKDQPRYLPDLENFIADDIILDTFDVEHIDIVALLWQTGYLTFAKKTERFGSVAYKMKVPNVEIQISLNALFLDHLTNQRVEKNEFRAGIYNALQAGDMESFKQALHVLFASIANNNYVNKMIQKYEGYYASVVYAYLASLGFQLIAEDTTNRGRIDLTIILPDKVYVMEFKVDGPEKALEQIRQKGYHEKYLDGTKKVFLLGMGFSSKERNITEFEWEKAISR